MKPVAATRLRGGIVAGRKPGLRLMALCEIVRRAGTAHSRRHPSRIDGVAQDFRPAPGDRERKRGEEQFAVRVRLVRVPSALYPVDITQRGFAAAVPEARNRARLVR